VSWSSVTTHMPPSPSFSGTWKCELVSPIIGASYDKNRDFSSTTNGAGEKIYLTKLRLFGLKSNRRGRGGKDQKLAEVFAIQRSVKVRSDKYVGIYMVLENPFRATSKTTEVSESGRTKLTSSSF
jgi:hypothetical protein